MVQVTIHLKGENLQDRDHSLFDKNDLSDPFFKVEYNGEEIARSEVIKNNLNPAWEPVKFELPAGFPQDGTGVFCIKVKDEDTGVNDSLAEFTLEYPIKKQSISEGVRKEGLIHVLSNDGKLKKEKCSFCSFLFGKKKEKAPKATEEKVKEKSEEKVKEKSEKSTKKSSKHSEKSESEKSVKEKSEKKEEKKEEAKADEQVAVAAE
jgi:hypothetical protein